MKTLFPLLFLLLFTLVVSAHTSKIDSVLPIRGLAIAAPTRASVDDFVKFIEDELVPGKFNLLILRVDWNYNYKSHPELRDKDPLMRKDVRKIVDVCQRYGIELIPQINLLGHQSWRKTTLALLREYPEFDETPHIDTEKDYSRWPNEHELYCKSYCPLHPGVHKVVFALVDEIMDVFEAEYFHAGMDEVFYIGEDTCPRCKGHDRAELFAGEVTTVRNHLALSNRKLMIWGDRLIDGKATGIGMWEASMNNTHRAIDMIPTDVFICDWHYERPDQTAVYFAMKGFNVVTCPWRSPDVAMEQLEDMMGFRESSAPVLAKRFRGIIATVWSSAKDFMKGYYALAKDDPKASPEAVVGLLMEEYKKMEQ